MRDMASRVLVDGWVELPCGGLKGVVVVGLGAGRFLFRVVERSGTWVVFQLPSVIQGAWEYWPQSSACMVAVAFKARRCVDFCSCCAGMDFCDWAPGFRKGFTENFRKMSCEI